jgi:hypothetical protein
VRTVFSYRVSINAWTDGIGLQIVPKLLIIVCFRKALALQVERRLRGFGWRSVGFLCTSYSAISGRVLFTKTTK